VCGRRVEEAEGQASAAVARAEGLEGRLKGALEEREGLRAGVQQKEGENMQLVQVGVRVWLWWVAWVGCAGAGRGGWTV
jgi:hypothetical protein